MSRLDEDVRGLRGDVCRGYEHGKKAPGYVNAKHGTMNNSRVAATAIVAAFLATALPVLAQIAPGDTGAGVKRGVQQMNNSGQVGDVQLFAEGSSTRVVLDIHSAGGRTEPAHIHRGKNCNTMSEINPEPVYPLKDVVNGHSETVLNVNEAKLLSGNYVVIVHAGNRMDQLTHYVSCGQLYRS